MRSPLPASTFITPKKRTRAPLAAGCEKVLQATQGGGGGGRGVCACVCMLALSGVPWLVEAKSNVCLRLHKVVFLCENTWAQISPLYKDTSHTGRGPTLMIALQFMIPGTTVQTRLHSEVLVVSTSTMKFGAGGDMAQLVTVNWGWKGWWHHSHCILCKWCECWYQWVS